MDDGEEFENIKLLVVGDQSVGKSSLILRYTEDSFSNNMISTIGVEFKRKKINIENKEINIIIYDSAGNERYTKITKHFYAGCHGILILYDANNKHTFEGISKWVQTLQIDQSLDVMVVGNKIDLEKNVTTEEGKIIAKDYGTLFVETSAKSGLGVNRAFELLIEKIIEKSKIPKVNSIKTISEVKNSKEANKKSKCC
jgi:small GTP-binding protein